MLRLSDISLGELEREVLEALWSDGALSPREVHERVGADRGISINTVSSALKRLFEKDLLEREKVSHSYVYRATVTREELQRHLIGAITTQFGDEGSANFLAAFVDLAEEHGEETLRRLEAMISARLSDTSQ